ncbi:MAG TPA: glycerol-3-phosphate acyltransferase [Coriobacteriia bacterium]|nr:glycerol-3-phosphate acyltransferase [Coriobacteriia bacterium]
MTVLSAAHDSIDLRVSFLSFVSQVRFDAMNDVLVPLVLIALAGYAIGSIPFSYIIVKSVTGKDITAHGTSNVGAMNVRRTTGSWLWFAVAMFADALKGFVPTFAAMSVPFILAGPPLLPGADGGLNGETLSHAAAVLFGPQAVVLGAVAGHNHSLWLSLIKRHWLGGKGLATGGGALLAYDWRYFLVVLGVGLAVIALTRYMMAGQVSAALSLPVFALATGQPDTLFVVLLAAMVYLRHHRRFLGLLKGREPKLYVEDNMGPKG